MSTRILKIITLVITLFSGFMASAQQINEPKNVPAEWSKPYPPFRSAGNLYYVGTYDLASYLIVTSQGNILINTGLAASASMIKANIETLGFKFSDIKILLTMQAHFDHMGAMAAIKKSTGAKFMVDEGDSAAVSDGGYSDYAMGGRDSMYEPVKIDRLLHDGDTIKSGNMSLVMLHHPGHTKGSCSFLFDVKDEHRSYSVLLANMPSIVTEKSFTEIDTYPDIARDYAYTLAAMKNLSFDIWLSSHASQFALHSKHTPGDAYNPAAFFDRKGYNKALKHLTAEYSRKVNNK